MFVPTRPDRKGPSFEKEVEQLLSLKGYSVDRNQLINGTQIDLVARRDDLLENLTLVVECTDRKESVGVDLVKQKASVLLSLSGARSLFRLLFVARSGFTAEAKAFADSNPQVTLLTPLELESQLIDFRPYSRWYISNYEASAGFFKEAKLFEGYVELAGIDETGKLVPSLTDAAFEWLQDERNNVLFLLGEYGSGKTSFSRQLVYHLLRQRFNEGADSAWLPLLVNLRDYRSTQNLRQVITDTLINRYGVAMPSFLAFERICETGRMLLVFDGFDEMSERSDKQVIMECFQQIYLLATLSTKVLLTCRSNFFKSHADILGLLKHFAIQVPADSYDTATISIDFSKQGKLLTVARLTEHQVREFIQKRFGEATESVLGSIRRIHDLSDLATRPVLLDMILTTLPELEAHQRRINSAALYEHYTNKWTSRDQWRITTPIEVRQQFSEALAWAMHRYSLDDVDFAFLHECLTGSIAGLLHSDHDIERFKNDIQTCSFLVRSAANDRFRFAHKSFLEYFVAKKMVRELLNGTLPKAPEVKSPKQDRQYILWDAFGDYPASWPARSTFVVATELMHQQWQNNSDARVALESWPQKSPQGLRSQIEEGVIALFARRVASEAIQLGLSEEIATFAIEILENSSTGLSNMVPKLQPDAAVLLADLLRLGKAGAYIDSNAAFLKEYVRAGNHGTLKLGCVAALAKKGDLLGFAFVESARGWLSGYDWTYMLYELANNAPLHEATLRQIFTFENLGPVDRVMCAWGLGLLNEGASETGNTLSKSVAGIEATVILEQMLTSSDLREVKLGLALCNFLGINEQTLADLVFGVCDRVSDTDVKRQAISQLELATSELVWKRCRVLAADSKHRDVAELLRFVERRVRDNGSAKQNRRGWMGRVDGRARERIWSLFRD